MNIKSLSLATLLASATTFSFAEISVNETQQPASESNPPVVVSDQEPNPTPQAPAPDSEQPTAQ